MNQVHTGILIVALCYFLPHSENMIDREPVMTDDSGSASPHIG
jgi:hypothetical protein